MTDSIGKLSEAVSQLFEQISTGAGGIKNIKVVVNIEPQAEPQAMAAPEEGQQPAAGVLTRQVLDNDQVASRWLSDNPFEPVTQEVRAPSEEEKEFWQDLLGIDPEQPEVNIDDGVAVWRINAPNVGDVATWVPYNANAEPIHMVVPVAEPGQDDLAAFQQCLRDYSAASDKLTKCWGMLLS